MSKPRIHVNDPGKLLVLCLIEVCATVALVLSHVTEANWLVVTTGVCAYMYGNGKLASKGKPPAPLLAPREPFGRRADDPPTSSSSSSSFQTPGDSPSPATGGPGAGTTETTPAPPQGRPPTVADWLRPPA